MDLNFEVCGANAVWSLFFQAMTAQTYSRSPESSSSPGIAPKKVSIFISFCRLLGGSLTDEMSFISRVFKNFVFKESIKLYFFYFSAENHRTDWKWHSTWFSNTKPSKYMYRTTNDWGFFPFQMHTYILFSMFLYYKFYNPL